MEDQNWFEMQEVRRRKYDSATWIPLLARQAGKIGNNGFEGFREDYFGIGHVAVPLAHRRKFEKLKWSNIGNSRHQKGWIDDGEYTPAQYTPAQVFQYSQKIVGEYLVLNQYFDTGDLSEWHLGQDFVTTLGLLRENDHWLRPEEGYELIARLTRDSEKAPTLMEVRSSHLRDYLCARGMALYLTSYRSRIEIVNSADHVVWVNGNVREQTGSDIWEGHVIPIHEGGMRFGEEWHVIHAGRTDVDPDDDVPSMGIPTNENVHFESWTRGSSGRKLFRISGEMWRTEWVGPAPASVIVRGNSVPPTVFFITDINGTQENRDTLDSEGRWLWFRPDVIMALAHRRGGSLGWYTRDTGHVAPIHGDDVHFGVNQLGLVNVYAKDIGQLPDWQQKIWVAHNVSPDGKVSAELLASQVRAEPTQTKAPEAFFGRSLETLNAISEKRFGVAFIRQHEKTPDILQQLHRFRAVNRDGVLALAKDIARATADSFDVSAMQTVISPSKGTAWGSLKTLEHVVATKVDSADARRIMGPLFAAYDLRLADAHLPKSDLDAAFSLLGVDESAPFVIQGYQLLDACVGCIYKICSVLDAHDDSDFPVRSSLNRRTE